MDGAVAHRCCYSRHAITRPTPFGPGCPDIQLLTGLRHWPTIGGLGTYDVAAFTAHIAASS